MAFADFCFYCSSCQILPLSNFMKDELIKAQDLIERSNFGSSSFAPKTALSRDPTLVSALALAPIFSNKLFKYFMKA